MIHDTVAEKIIEVNHDDIKGLVDAMLSLMAHGKTVISARANFYGASEIHLKSDDFLRLYGAKNRRKFDNKYDVVETVIDGIKVFSLINNWEF